MPIDYSKFDKIECSDDEKVTSTPVGSTCGNCSKAIPSPLRCSRCKKATYCSQLCQKDDWKYHKRNCSVPAPESSGSDSSSGSEKSSLSGSGPKPSKPRPESSAEVENEKLDWYRHREWKPDTVVDKTAFTPTPISPSEPTPTVPVPESARHKSAWNHADTWEERDCMQLVQSWLTDNVRSIPQVKRASISDIEGFASITNVRGKVRYLFDLSFKLKSDSTSFEVRDFSSCSDSPAEVVSTNKSIAASISPEIDRLKNALTQYMQSL